MGLNTVKDIDQMRFSAWRGYHRTDTNIHDCTHFQNMASIISLDIRVPPICVSETDVTSLLGRFPELESPRLRTTAETANDTVKLGTDSDEIEIMREEVYIFNSPSLSLQKQFLTFSSVEDSFLSNESVEDAFLANISDITPAKTHSISGDSGEFPKWQEIEDGIPLSPINESFGVIEVPNFEVSFEFAEDEWEDIDPFVSVVEINDAATLGSIDTPTVTMWGLSVIMEEEEC